MGGEKVGLAAIRKQDPHARCQLIERCTFLWRNATKYRSRLVLGSMYQTAPSLRSSLESHDGLTGGGAVVDSGASLRSICATASVVGAYANATPLTSSTATTHTAGIRPVIISIPYSCRASNAACHSRTSVPAAASCAGVINLAVESRVPANPPCLSADA